MGDGWLFQQVLWRLNQKVLHWDVPFEQLAQDPAHEVKSFCRHWGVPLEPWPWSKAPEEYVSANDFFMRDYAFAAAPEQNLAESLVVSPATAVVTWF
ncbi:psd, partial [Symbiodinium sp. KB8]